MIRVLSLLLIIPLLCTQLWAINGGPYNSLNSREISAFSGTYGISMRGMQRVPVGSQDDQSVLNKPLTYRESDPANDNDVSTTAVLYLTVPNSGIVNGKIMLFHKGLMYIGTSTGMVERRRMSILMLSELTHYIVLSGTEYRQTVVSSAQSASVPQSSQAYFQSVGLYGTPRAVMDSMLAGQIDLTLSLDQFTGLIAVDGWANYVEVGAESPDLLNTGTLSSITRDMVTSLISVSNGVFTGGTWSTMQTPEKVKQPQNTKVNGLNGLKLKAEGSRNTTDTVAIANFVAPRSGTYWQIWGGVPSDLYGSNAAASGGGDGAGAATAALAAVSNVANNVVGGTQVSQLQTGSNNATLTVTGIGAPTTTTTTTTAPATTTAPTTTTTTTVPQDPNGINNFLNNF